MKGQRWRERFRESAKLGVRVGLGKADLSIGRDPYIHRLSRTLEHASIDTVLDVGANVGQFSKLLRAAGYSGQIISAEPLSDAFKKLERRARGDKLWHTVQAAVGAEPGRTEINVSANSYSSSLLPMTATHLAADPRSAVIGTEEVDVVTVADLVAKFDVVPKCSLLKIDTQGFEQEVLDGAGALLDEFAAIQLELSFVELYEGQRLFDDLVDDLSRRGLSMWALETGMSDDKGRLLECDALFLRNTRSAT